MLNNDLKKLMQDNLRYSETLHQLLINNNTEEHKNFKALLEKSLKYNQAVYLGMEKIRRYILWLKIINLIKILIIIVPIVLAVIYLPPLLRNFFGPYLDLLKTSGPAAGVNISELLNQFK